MSNQIKRPRFYKCFGFYCWHDYPSNPSIIELLASTDGQNFITWTVIHAELVIENNNIFLIIYIESWCSIIPDRSFSNSIQFPQSNENILLRRFS